MVTEQMISRMRNILVDYDAFKEIAISMNWEKAETCYKELKRERFHVDVCVLRFPKDYVKKNCLEASVQMLLTDIAYGEDWNKDFFAELTYEDRVEIFTETKELYQSFLKMRCVKFSNMSHETFLEEVEQFLQTESVETDPLDDFHQKCKNMKELLCEFKEGEVFFVGEGYGILDRKWILCKNDMFLYLDLYVVD